MIRILFFMFSDQLSVQLYKVDVKDVHKRQPKANFNIEGFFGLETGFSYDKETNVLAIVCQKQVTLFSFENRDNLIQFEIKIRRSLGEGTKSWKKLYLLKKYLNYLFGNIFFSPNVRIMSKKFKRIWMNLTKEYKS